jgi:dihydrofolate reductase
MRKLIAITQVSLDGVMQGPGGPEEDPSNGFTEGGWAMRFVDDDAGRVINEIMAAEFDLLLGRRTYDIWVGYWPKHVDNPIGKAFDKATKYVVTHRPSDLSWKISRPVGVDVVENVRRLKESKGPDLHLWGSSRLLQTLIAANLVDEHRLWVFPIILGKGKRLFENGVPPRGYALVSTESTPSGVLFNTYRPAGPLS